jgi:hypothetical protein
MTLTAIARENADVAADKADRSIYAAGADLGCLLGSGTSHSGFACQQRRRVIAQTEAGSMLDGELASQADNSRDDVQMAAQCVSQFIGSRQRANRRGANTHNGSADWLAGEHLVEIDNTMHVGERHTEGAAHFRGDGFGQPAVELLCQMQSRQERSAPLRR